MSIQVAERGDRLAAVFDAVTPAGRRTGRRAASDISAYATPARSTGTLYFSATSAGPIISALASLGPRTARAQAPDRSAHHLQQVPVAADHHHRIVGLGEGERPDHVVGLTALGAGCGDPRRGEDVWDHRDLRGEACRAHPSMSPPDSVPGRFSHPMRLGGRRDQIGPELRPPIGIRHTTSRLGCSRA